MTTAAPETQGGNQPLVSGSVVRGAGWLGAGAVVVKTAQTVVLLALAAMLAPSAIGILAIGALVLNISSAVTDLGSSTALVHWRGDAERAARSALTLALCLSWALTAAVWLAAPALSRLTNAGDLGVDVVRGLVLCLPFSAVAGVSQELLRRELAFKRRVLPDIAGAVAGAVLAIVLAIHGWGVYSLVVGQLVQAVLVMVLCWSMRPPVTPGWSRRDITGLVSYGGHLAGANILTLLMLNVDYVIVARALGSTELGVYSMAFRLAYMPYLLVGVVISGAAFAHLCRLRGSDVGHAVTQAAGSVCALVLPLYLGMALLAPQMELLGSTWAPGVEPLRWLAGYGLGLSLATLCLTALSAVARTRDMFALNGLHLVLLTVLLLWWVDGGVVMVAVAQLVAVTLTLLAAGTVLRRRVDGLSGRLLGRILIPVLLGALAMAATVLVAEQLLPWVRVSALGLFLVGSLAVAAYVLVLAVVDGGRHFPNVPVLRGRR